MKRQIYPCPQCSHSAPSFSGRVHGQNRRRCRNCGFQFLTRVEHGREIFDREFISRSPNKGQNGGYGQPPQRRFKLAYHHYLVDYTYYSKLDPANENGFRLLRDPKTGRPVARQHADLKPNEISLVLE